MKPKRTNFHSQERKTNSKNFPKGIKVAKPLNLSNHQAGEILKKLEKRKKNKDDIEKAKHLAQQQVREEVSQWTRDELRRLVKSSSALVEIWIENIPSDINFVEELCQIAREQGNETFLSTLWNSFQKSIEKFQGIVSQNQSKNSAHELKRTQFFDAIDDARSYQVGTNHVIRFGHNGINLFEKYANAWVPVYSGGLPSLGKRSR